MPKTIELQMTTPEKVALQTTAEFVVLPAVKGEMGVLPGHAPFIVEMEPGEVRVTSQGEVRRFAVSGGFAEVGRDKVSLFVETAEMAEAISAERAHQALEKAKADAGRKDLDPLTLAQAEAALRRASVRLRVSRKAGQRRSLPPSENH